MLLLFYAVKVLYMIIQVENSNSWKHSSMNYW